MWRALLQTALLVAPSLSNPPSWTSFKGKKWGWNWGDSFSQEARLPGQTYFPQQSNSFYNSLWKSAGIVPDILSEVPRETLKIQFPFGTEVYPNASVTTGLMLEKPRLTWSAEPGALYTVLLVDNGIERLMGKQFIHWMVVNVPGNAVERGEENYEYIPVFYFDTPNMMLDRNSQKSHKILFLVYKQQGKVSGVRSQKGCTPGIAMRVGDKDNLASQYNLQLVAGSFFFSKYSGRPTDQLLCRFSRCTGKPFPFPLPGVNTGPECQPSGNV